MGCGHQEQFYSCADVQITAAAHGRHHPSANGWTTPSAPTTWSWDRAQRGKGERSTATPSFWTRVPGVPGWRQNPAFSTSTTSSTTLSTPKARFWPWWFFDKDAGWFNRDVWAETTVAPTQPTTESWGDWTLRPQTTRVPFWNRWFLDQTTKTNPRNIPLVNPKKKQDTKNKLLGFWERVFSRARQTIWSWLLKGRKIGRTSRRKPKTTRRTTTTTTTTPQTRRTTSQWWKWWEHDRRKTTTPAPKYRSWWDSWPWARVWDDDTDSQIKSRPRWRPRTHRTKPSTTTTTTTESWSSAVEEQGDWHNDYNDNNDYNDMGGEYDRNENEGYEKVASSEVAQITSDCYPMGIWTSLPGMKQWCLLNCAAGFCPHGYCSPGCSD